MECPSENTLTEFMEGRLSAAARSSVNGHLDTCAACRALLSDLAKAEADSSGPPAPSFAPGHDDTAALGMLSTPPSKDASVLPRPDAFPTSRRFEIVRKLGQGGMGVVYEAYDRSRQRRVACKTLRSMSPESLLRFKQEFRALQDVQHENLVALEDLVEESGQWWFTMELVRGVDFLTYAEDEPQLRAALIQLVAGLCALHGASKVHRDIKPQNVLVTASGRVVILDFGLIGDVEQVDSAIVGTAAYMAPEQAQGDAIEPAADWYSVGVMLYEALTGKRPFPPGTRARGAVVPPRVHRPDVAADLDALCCELLQIDPARRPRGADILRRLHSPQNATPQLDTPSRNEPASIATPPPFVGRGEELSTLREALSRSRSGQSILVMIEGESGVGKSALVQHFLTQLRADFADAVVLTGRCYEREAVPFKAFDGIIDMLSRYLKRLSRVEATALLPRRAAALLQAFPVLGRVEAMLDVPAGPVVDSTEQRSRVFAALREMLARIGERHPLVLAIDDLQWADSDSIAMLGQLLQPPDPPALLLLSTVRLLDAGRPAGFDAALSRVAEVKRLCIGPLPPEDARALAERLLRRASPLEPAAVLSSDLATDLARESGGHPLFIDALIQHAASRGPQTPGSLRLDDAMAASIDRMEDAARRLLSIVAVAGRPVEVKTLAAAAELDSAEFGRIERVLRAAHLTRALAPTAQADSSARFSTRDSESIEAYHDRVREITIAHLSKQDLSSCHRQLATAFESSGQAEPEELALHFRGAGELAKAARYTLQAAERATQALAFAHAATLYENALALEIADPIERRRAQVQLGQMRAAAGRPREAAQAFLAVAETTTDETRLVHKQRAAELILQTGAFAEGQAILADVLRAVELKFSLTGWRSALRLLWLRLRIFLRGLRYRERQEIDIPPRELLRLDACWTAALGHLTHAPLQAMALQAQHLLLALEAGEPMRLARALLTEAIMRNFIGRRQWPRVDALIEESRKLGEKIDSPYVLGFGTTIAGAVQFHRGRLKRSVELAQQAEAILKERCPQASWELRMTRGLIVLLLGMLGRFKDLAAVLPAFVQDATDRGDAGMVNSGQIWLVVLHLAHDDVERARALIVEMKELVRNTGSSMHDSNVLHAEVILAYYTQPERTLTALFSDWLPRISADASMWRSHLFNNWVWFNEAAGQLLAKDRELSPRRVRQLANQLAKVGEAMQTGQSLALRAALAYRLDQRDEAAQLMARAEKILQDGEFSIHAAAARYRHGQYLGQDAGRALRESAAAAMSAEGIRNVDKFVLTMFP